MTIPPANPRTPTERVEDAMRTIRIYMRDVHGRTDDAACFWWATVLLCNEQEGGFHRSPPSVLTDLKLDQKAPIE